MGLQEVDEALELRWVAGADVGGQADEVLGVFDAADQAVHGLAAVVGVDENGTYLTSGGFQQEVAAIGQVDYNLLRHSGTESP